MRKIFLLFLTAVLFGSTVSFASCTANEDSTIVVNQPTITRIQNRGTVLIGTTGDYRPLSFREPDGRYWGFGIEMAQEIPSLVAEGKADVMITEITEAPYYVQTDARLAAPLLNTPFNHGEIGVLMRKGQDDLLQLVNDLIRQMKSDGSLRRLHEKYGLVYGY